MLKENKISHVVLTVNFCVNDSKMPCPDDLMHYLIESSKEQNCGSDEKDVSH